MGKIDIGLRQARLLCGMKHRERLDFIAEGLPLILDSAQGFWAASQQLTVSPREAGVLEGHAEEDAAKALILLDIVRCPPKICAGKMGKLLKWFYDHLARLIYARAASWKPMNVAQLQEYADHERKAHYLEGAMGEYIMPNWELFERESRLYVDIMASEGGIGGWSEPRQYSAGLPSIKPAALSIAEALAAIGIFQPEALREVADVWGTVEFVEKQGYADSCQLTEQLMTRLVEKKLILSTADQRDVSCIYHCWQMPMYSLDLTLLPVPLGELEAEREATLYAEIGSGW